MPGPLSLSKGGDRTVVPREHVDRLSDRIGPSATRSLSRNPVTGPQPGHWAATRSLSLSKCRRPPCDNLRCRFGKNHVFAAGVTAG
ncbi:hypothetical protein SAMN06295973_0396 [Plantibacter cousiniae]|uniref:Uncharacterized protein n=1 Tax=Plantibacter cousiniae (nom. nud.) TaxID=199709 RepID=A0ABY1LIP0_9MICO|nr:hypothetical protein SAMN06295973_0396 [Plantibacter cousiniae]